jgi:hypothetical protein
MKKIVEQVRWSNALVQAGHALILGLCLAGLQAQGSVTRLEIKRVESPTFGGTAFGNVGPYEKLVGVVYMEVDPHDRANAGIVNLDRAPRNAKGNVEYNADIFILKPVDMRRGNQKIFFEVHNRGNKLALNFLNDTRGGVNDPGAPADAGNGFLFRQGYTVVWTGWQGDVTAPDNRMTIRLPVATHRDGSPIVANVRQEYSDRFIPVAGTLTLPLSGSAQFASYESTTLDTRKATLTVRGRGDAAKTRIPPDKWAFARCTRNADGTLALIPSAFDLCVFEGFKIANLYELIFPAKNPTVMGLGYTVTRDVGSFLRHQVRDAAGTPNPLAINGSGSKATGITHAYVLGISSSGMYLRDFLYLGYNADEAGRRVFDGAWAHIPGAHRLLANVEFAQPNDYSRQDIWHDYISASIFPFGYSVTTDPITGRTDGILKRQPRRAERRQGADEDDEREGRPGASESDPFLFVTETSTEFWQFQASLVNQDTDGNPVPLPKTARRYLFSSYHHVVGPGGPPARGLCQQLSNPMSGAPLARALLVSLDQWVATGKQPPDSRIPEGRNLVPPDQDSTGFPSIPGVRYHGLVNELKIWNYGPQFGPTGGRMTILPPIPIPGTDHDIRVPRVDEDGHDIAGIRSPNLDAPIATYTGWNTRAAGFREGDSCGLTGSFIPLPNTKTERVAKGDPRKSIAERYGDHDGYVRAVSAAAEKLASKRFLLPEDVERYVADAQASSVLR